MAVLHLTVDGDEAGLAQAAIDALEVMETFATLPRSYAIGGGGFDVTVTVAAARVPEPAPVTSPTGAALHLHRETREVAWLVAPLPGWVPLTAPSPP